MNDLTFNKLLETFLKKGGRVDNYYLRETNRSRRTLVYLNGWFSGQNVRAAILKAFEKV